jgi:formate dehydrogenase iron-sulfur subunit
MSTLPETAWYSDTGGPRRMGFFTDTTVCIGCKACEVACKEWNGIPDSGLSFTGDSLDNTGDLGANAWRHVAFVEQPAAGGRTVGRDGGGRAADLDWFGAAAQADGSAADMRFLMSSDVCKHCTRAGCLDVCPTGAIFRTEFGTVVVQEDICNGCGYCVTACPFGVIERRAGDGRAWKCTLCYDRTRDHLEPACSKACPTDSIQFGPLDELRARARDRVEQVVAAGGVGARLYGDDPADGVGGCGAFFLLLDDPEVYGLPPDPVVPTRDLTGMWAAVGAAAALLAAGVAAVTGGSR